MKREKLKVTLQDSPTERMFQAAVYAIAEISKALGIPDEEAACANGNELILERIEQLMGQPRQEPPPSALMVANTKLVGALDLIRETLEGGNVQDLIYTINEALAANRKALETATCQRCGSRASEYCDDSCASGVAGTRHQSPCTKDPHGLSPGPASTQGKGEA